MNQHHNSSNNSTKQHIYGPINPPVSAKKEAALPVKDFADNYKAIGKNTLKFTCDFHTKSGLVFRGLMIHQREGDDSSRRWVQVPSKEFQKADGTRGFVPIIEFANPERFQAFKTAALTAVDEMLKEGGNE